MCPFLLGFLESLKVVMLSMTPGFASTILLRLLCSSVKNARKYLYANVCRQKHIGDHHEKLVFSGACIVLLGFRKRDLIVTSVETTITRSAC